MTVARRLAMHSDRVGGPDACWLWTAGRDRYGYGQMRLVRPRRLVGAHRVAWELANGPIPDGMCVCHHCDTPACVNPTHLFLGTIGDNMRDKARKGRCGPGAMSGPVEYWNHHTTLTPYLVRCIRALVHDGHTHRAVGRWFGVSHVAVTDAVSRRSWSYVR